MKKPTLLLALLLASAACDAAKTVSGDSPAASASVATPAPPAVSAAPAPSAAPASTGPMVSIPGGQLVAGSACGAVPRVTNEEAPGVAVGLGPFRIDVHPWPNDPTKPPETGYSRDRAAAACASVGKRLCTETEWERACKGPQNATFEYGNAHDKEACKPGAPNPGARARCTSAFGVKDMHGLVFEWTDTPWGRTADASLFTVKGSAGAASILRERCANGQGRAPQVGSSDLGFRCCADATNTAQPFVPPPKRPVIEQDRRVDPILEEAMLKAMPPDHRTIDGARVGFDRVWRWHPRAGEELLVARWFARPVKGKAGFELAVFKECGSVPTRIARMRGPVARLDRLEAGSSPEKLVVDVESAKDRGEVAFTYWYGSVKVDEPAWLKAGNLLPRLDLKIVDDRKTAPKPGVKVRR